MHNNRFTYFNEEWNENDDESTYIDNIDDKPKPKSSGVVED